MSNLSPAAPVAPMLDEQKVTALVARDASMVATLPVQFVAPIVPSIPGIRAFAPSVPGTLVDRPATVALAEIAAKTQARVPSTIAALTDVQRAVLSPETIARLQLVNRLALTGMDGFIPDHLAVNPVTPVLDPQFITRPFFVADAQLGPDEFQATTIFAPDQRQVFSDTRFPWCTTGRVSTGGGWGSGTLVGPRHLLCASHMMTWNPDNSVNQVTFVPSYFDGNAPFGSSGIIHWYAYRKVVGPTLQTADTEEDYVVLVLSNRLGDLCGYMGTRGYDSSWDGQPYWDHIGYPGDLTGGSRPSFQNAISVNSVVGGSEDEYLSQQADVWPGQSGGPFFAWWANEAWPRVVGVQSAQNSSNNSAGGGNDIPHLVNQARNDFP